MNSIPSLRDMCLTKIADIKYHDTETIIPFENISSDIINELFTRLATSDNKITIKMPPDGNTLQISVPHNASMTEFCEKVARALNTPFHGIRLLFKGKEGKTVAVGGINDKTLCEWTGIKLGESATATLIYTPSQPGQNYPKWPIKKI